MVEAPTSKSTVSNKHIASHRAKDTGLLPTRRPFCFRNLAFGATYLFSLHTFKFLLLCFNSPITSEPVKPQAPTLHPRESRTPDPCTHSLSFPGPRYVATGVLHHFQVLQAINMYLFNFLMVTAEGYLGIIRTTMAGLARTLINDRLRPIQNNRRVYGLNNNYYTYIHIIMMQIKKQDVVSTLEPSKYYSPITSALFLHEVIHPFFCDNHSFNFLHSYQNHTVFFCGMLLFLHVFVKFTPIDMYRLVFYFILFLSYIVLLHYYTTKYLPILLTNFGLF